MDGITKIFVIVIGFLAVISSSCVDKETENLKEMIAFTAVYESTYSTGRPVEKLVVMNFNNQDDYQILTDSNVVAQIPTFVENKTYIIYGDDNGWSHNVQLFSYNLETSFSDTLFANRHVQLPLLAERFTPTINNEGIYFSMGPQPFGGRVDIHYYSFIEDSAKLIYNGNGYSVGVVNMIGEDTLVVWSNEEPVIGKNSGYWLMDLYGSYLSFLDNPYLEYVSKNNIIKKAAQELEWNHARRLFVYSELDSTVQGSKISVTDLYGNYYQSYTEGIYMDKRPKWGPENTIIFERCDVGNIYYTGYKLMIIDLNTGNASELVDPENIDGAVGIRMVDY